MSQRPRELGESGQSGEPRVPLLLAIFALFGTGCLGDPYDTDSLAGERAECGEVAEGEVCLILRFEPTDEVRDAAPMRGDLHWAIYEGGDVTVFGPGDNPALDGGEVQGVDLSEPGSHVDVVLEGFEKGEYQVLGFLDANGNGSADKGEAVTLPRKSFGVPAGRPVVVHVSLDCVHP